METTLTVEPGFKSTVDVPPTRVTDLLTIGELAGRAGVATSAVRFYERQGLLDPDERVSGQRRYRHQTLRRLVFIGMLQESGLSLDDIGRILHATDVEEWKAIGRARLDDLTAEIERLEDARQRLELSLLCRFDHPLTECRWMGEEIDRRLDLGPPPTGSSETGS